MSRFGKARQHGAMETLRPWWRTRSHARVVLGRAISSAPLTFAYAVVLLGTTVALRHSPSATAQQWLDASSTDVAHLGKDPVTVLVRSAFLLPERLWVTYAIVLLLMVAPLERRIGTPRTALVFISGHVLATLLTELPVAAAIGIGWLSPAAAHRMDVGASYGTLALVAALAGGLPRHQGLVVLGLAILLVAGATMTELGMSTYGHLLAMAIGVCWWPVLYHDRESRRVRRPRPATHPHP